jgi:hypothetical protein
MITTAGLSVLSAGIIATGRLHLADNGDSPGHSAGVPISRSLGIEQI